MKEPSPFLPLWKVFRGESAEQGSGLLTGELNRVVSFSVFVGNSVIEVNPELGTIALDGNPVIPPQGPSRLVWFRRMQFQLGTQDQNHFKPDCLWYGIGLEKDGIKTGYRLYADGKIDQGIS